MAPPPRCGSGRHDSIVQKARDHGTLRNTQSKTVKNFVIEFFGIKRRKYSYICTTCIAHARQQTRMQGRTATTAEPESEALLEEQAMGEEIPALQVDLEVASTSHQNVSAETEALLEEQAMGEEIPALQVDLEVASTSHQNVAAEPRLEASSSMVDQDAVVAADKQDVAISMEQEDVLLLSSDQEPIQEDASVVVQSTIDLLRTGGLSQQCLRELAGALGDALNAGLLQDADSLSANFKDLNYMESISPEAWLKERDPSIIEFMRRVTSKKGKDGRTVSDIRLAHAYEQLMGCRNSRFVGAMHFSESLVKNTFHHSASACAIDSSISPSESTTTHRSFLASSAAAPSELPCGDIEIWFDNNQVVGKTTRVAEGGKALMSGCTMLCSVQIPGESLQEDASLKPALYETTETEALKTALGKVEEEEQSLQEKFREYRLKFWEKTLEEVVLEQKSTERGIEDYVDRVAAQVTAGTSNSVCRHCLAVERDSFKKCPACDEPSARPPVRREDSLHNVPSEHTGNVTVQVGEVHPEMPNSYATCRKVLDHIRQQARVGEGRKWLSVGCDGQPFDVCRKLIDETMVCELCGQEGDEAIMKQHLEDCHPDASQQAFRKVFDWVLLRPGPGHVEMNICKALFRLLWSPLLKTVSRLLGFTSDAAQGFIKNCGNFHVTWQIVRVVLESVSKELTISYVRHCLNAHQRVSAEGMLMWAAASENCNYVLIHKLCDLVFATSLMRAGLRRNNAKVMLAGRQRASLLFFTGPHFTYRRLIIRDMIQRVQMPDQVKQFIEDRTAYSVSGDSTRGEGGDFVLENKNRQTKSWLPPGQPSLSQWQQAARCGDRLERMKTTVLERCEVETTSYSDYVIPLQDSVDAVRVELRRTAYLANPGSTVEYLQGISGVYLHHDLVNFDVTSVNNQKAFRAQMVGEGGEIARVPVLPDDDSLSTMTKAELQNRLTAVISTSYDGQERDMRMRTMRRASKSALLSLLQESAGDADEA